MDSRAHIGFVSIDVARHHAAVRIARPGALEGSRVATVSLDDRVAEAAPDSARPVVVKLDVEGAEIDVVAAAPETLARDFLLIYEDHGMDPDHKTQPLRPREALPPATPRRPAGRLYRVPDLPAVAVLKHRPTRGYNLFATRPGTPFDDLLARLVAPRLHSGA